jgi:glutamate racemase
MTVPPPLPPVRIGIFDSGLGGLSVLLAVRRLLTHADLFYIADSAHAPYGEKTHEDVQARSLTIARWFRSIDADVLVIACNTATAVASQLLRNQHPGWPIVGVEPGIKPAAALTRTGHIGVMATEVTLRSDKFALLAQAHAAHVELLLQPCPGLAAAIEAGDVNAAAVRERVAACCAPLRSATTDTAAIDIVVLGCTHYPFVAHHIQAELGAGVTLIDTADAVARRTQAVCPTRLNGPHRPGRTCLWSTGSIETLQRVATHWLPFPWEIEAPPANALNV